MPKKIILMILMISIVILFVVGFTFASLDLDKEKTWESVLNGRGEEFRIDELKLHVNKNETLFGSGDLYYLGEADKLTNMKSFEMKIVARDETKEYVVFQRNASSASPMYYLYKKNPFAFSVKNKTDLNYKNMKYYLLIRYTISGQSEKSEEIKLE